MVQLRNDVSQYYFDSCYQLITSNMKQVNKTDSPEEILYITKVTHYSRFPVNAAMSLFKKRKQRKKKEKVFLYWLPGSSLHKLKTSLRRRS